MEPERHQRVTALFLEACELEEADREAFLAELASEDASLRSAVEELLQADARSGEVMPTTGSFRDALEELEDAPVPDEIGPYRVLGVLGEGGMGIVYEAERDLPRRRVALKVIRPGLVTKEFLKSFEHEVQVLARLQNPGVAQVYDAGIADGPTGRVPYFAMELVGGPALLDHARKQNLTVRQRLELFAQVCDAVHYAHLKGVIHRDLKPANILVHSSGQPKVLDFGIARATASDEYTLTQPTAHSTLVGSVPYMSPEQASGAFKDLDARSDVYALGVILYEMLAGDLPYPVKDAALLESVRIIQEREPRPLGRVDPVFRGDLEAISTMALEKEPERRFQSAAELAADVRRYLSGQPVTARVPSAFYVAKKFTLRHKLVSALGMLLFVALSVGLAVFASLYTKEQRLLAKEVGLTEQKDDALKKERVALAKERAARAKVTRRGEHLLRLLRAIEDSAVLDELKRREEADTWPRRPEMIPSMETWLGDADEMVKRLPQYEETLAELRADQDQADQAQFSLQLGDLEEHIDKLQRFQAGPMSDVEDRIAFAETIEERTVDDYFEEWNEAIDDITHSPHYSELKIEPQVGLVPLGLDPVTGLWEFWFWESDGTGEAGEGKEMPRRNPETDQWIIREDTGMILVLIPGGSFDMGSKESDDEQPIDKVTLNAFFLSKYEMTQAQWRRIMDANPSVYSPGDKFELAANRITQVHPVENASWRDCEIALNRLNLVLPTEARWEYAAKAGTTGRWWAGDDREKLEGCENLADLSVLDRGSSWKLENWNDRYVLHAPVGSFRANRFGLHDTLGNVKEWCLDPAGRYEDPVDPVDGQRIVKDPAGRMCRGGSMATDAPNARCSSRYAYAPDSRSYDIGVRPARPLSSN